MTPDAATLVNSMQATGDNKSIPSEPAVLEGGKTEPSSNGIIDFGKLMIRKLT
jgi:hypothetical protein